MADTHRDVGGTARDDPGGSGTSRDPGVTRHEGVPPSRPAQESLLRLPGSLAGRFTVVGELPTPGAESDLMHVRDADGDHVVKIFRRGFTADRDVWAKLPRLDTSEVVRVEETGHAEGRDYEVLEYLPLGNLRALGAPLDVDAVIRVVTQLAEGLRRLHEVGIVHRDLKPENVLVRSVDPIRLAIADFGLSRVIEQSVVFASSSRTLAYAAPESLSGQVSPARDWWSLGMMARELATGRAPFAGLSETVVVDHLATRPVNCDDVADPRLKLLCRGLLVRDPRRRWGAREVAEFLGGAAPAVPEEPAQGPASAPGTGVAFRGQAYNDRRELAAALTQAWDEAARYFFGSMVGPTGPSEAWRGLRAWLRTDPGGAYLIDAHLTGDLPPDVKLLHLLHWLDPEAAPQFAGLRLLSSDLPSLAGIAADTGHAQHGRAARVARAVWESRALPVLAEFPGGAHLGSLDDRWRDLARDWDRMTAWLRTQLPNSASSALPSAVDGEVLPVLFALAADPEGTRASLTRAAEGARASVQRNGAPRIAWFDWLVENLRDDPLRRLALVRTAPIAVAEVESQRRRQVEQATLSAETERRRQEREAERLGGRKSARVRAVAWTLPLLVVWLAGSWIAPHILGSASVQSTTGSTGLSYDPTPLLIVAAVVAWLVAVGCELFLAERQGSDYMKAGPWSGISAVAGTAGRGLTRASRTLSGATRRQDSRGCIAIVLVTVFVLLVILVLFSVVLSIAWLVWLGVMVVAAVGHLVFTGIRLQRWEAERRTPIA